MIAPEQERGSALLTAARALLRQWRCHTVAATLSAANEQVAQKDLEKGLRFKSSLRTVRRYLPLSPTFEATLRERFTPRKRKNLLYYDRRLLKGYDVEFVHNLK